MNIRVTSIGAATLLFDFDGLTVLTDPALDDAGSSFALPVPALNSSLKLTRAIAPAMKAENLPPIDTVLLSHDLHPDHFDASGRRVADEAGVVITTRSGAARLGPNAVGLNPGEPYRLRKNDHEVIVTATPARHGPPGVEEIVGEVIGFVLRPSDTASSLYISGDTVDYPDLDSIADHSPIGSAFLHLGCARFPQTGPTTFTMDSSQACAVAARLNPWTVIPVHYDSWSHFTESPDEARTEFSSSAIADRVRWLEPGIPNAISWPSLEV